MTALGLLNLLRMLDLSLISRQGEGDFQKGHKIRGKVKSEEAC